MSVQINHSQDAWLGLESEHALVVGLVLPSRAMHHSHTLVIADIMPVYVTSYEDVRNGRDYQPILWLGR